MILFEHGLHKYVDGDKRKRSHNLQNDKHISQGHYGFHSFPVVD
jgi:hypothetical protein